MKAHFNYNPKHDADIPCKALGLTFQRGDILEVSNQDDPEWWQVHTYIHVRCKIYVIYTVDGPSAWEVWTHLFTAEVTLASFRAPIPMFSIIITNIEKLVKG